MPGELLSRISTPFAAEHDELAALSGVLRSMSLHEIRRFLLGIARNENVIAAVARRSSVHANGFVKVVLERERGMALRLHVWHADKARDTELEENIHDHVWAFASVVLIGQLDEERYAEHSAGLLADRYRYIRDRATLPPGNLRRAGSARLTRTAELSHPAGTSYRVDSSLLHRARSITDNGLGATLAIMGVQRKPNASVFAEPDRAARKDVEQGALSIDDTVTLVRSVADAI
jgi:hypothetical protein